MDHEVNILVEKMWKQYDDFTADESIRNFIVKVPPILYEGNLKRYQESSLKVITIALNPANKWADKNVYSKEFPTWGEINNYYELKSEPKRYLQGLNEYFNKPAYKWFKIFTPIFDEIGVSFDNKQNNQVLHTDLCPLTTIPNWGKLDFTIQDRLAEKGSELWCELISYLKPHLILASFARRYLSNIRLKPLNEESCDLSNLNIWTEIYRVPDKYFAVHAIPLNVKGNSEETIMVFGTARKTPFFINNVERTTVGKYISTYLKNKK